MYKKLYLSEDSVRGMDSCGVYKSDQLVPNRCTAQDAAPRGTNYLCPPHRSGTCCRVQAAPAVQIVQRETEKTSAQTDQSPSPLFFRSLSECYQNRLQSLNSGTNISSKVFFLPSLTDRNNDPFYTSLLYWELHYFLLYLKRLGSYYSHREIQTINHIK